MNGWLTKFAKLEHMWRLLLSIINCDLADSDRIDICSYYRGTGIKFASLIYMVFTLQSLILLQLALLNPQARFGVLVIFAFLKSKSVGKA